MTSFRTAGLAALLLVPIVNAAEAQPATMRLGNDVVPVRQFLSVVADPRADGYRGSVRIDLEVKKPATAFRLHAKNLAIGAMTLSQGGKSVAIQHAAGANDTLDITPARALRRGRAQLTIEFTNQYSSTPDGFTKVHPRSGEPMLITDFEPIDARRMFPCFDEPRFKIPYEITVEIPAELDAVSNTPIAAERRSGTTKSVRFRPTPPLPAYLIALAIGQFDYTEIAGTSIPTRIVSPKGNGRLASIAAGLTPPILHALEQYFGSKYPFEKLDLIAVPEFTNAMENAGAIVFGDRYIHLDPATVTPTQKSFLMKLLAHEIAHMWFGDLVTMEGWDDLWLNEAFADWLGDRIAREQFPESASDLEELSRVQTAMNADGRATTDPTRTRNVIPGQVFSNYVTVYLKGKAVLVMFESWIGSDRFRLGVLHHLRSHAGGNANADDFFAALGRHAPASTAAAFQSFVDLPGIPLVSIERTGPTSIVLKQSRFTTAANPLKAQPWKIPVTIRYSDGTTTRTASVLLDGTARTLQLEGERIAWLFPDAGATGYYRWNAPIEWIDALATRSGELLDPRERFALIGNLGALFRAGTIHGDAYLELLGRFANDTSPEVLSGLLAAFNELRLPFETAATRAQLSAYFRTTLRHAIEQIGFTPKAGESLAITSVRPDLLLFLGLYGDDESVRQFAREELAKYRQDPSSVPASLIEPVLFISADRGDEALFEEMRTRFEAAPSPTERRLFARVLGRFHDPAVKKKTRAYALAPNVRWSEITSIAGLPVSESEREEFYQWATANYAELANATARPPSAPSPSSPRGANRSGSPPHAASSRRTKWKAPNDNSSGAPNRFANARRFARASSVS